MSTSMRKQKTTGWKTFLQPGWILTLLAVLAFSYTALTILSPWQLNKDDRIVERNEHIANAYASDPKNFSEVFDSTGAIIHDQEWMRVRLTGHFIVDQEVLLRLRPVESGPVYQSLTPFQLDNGPIMLVNRGFEPTTAGTVAHVPAPVMGTVTITANARYNEALPSTAPINQDGYTQVYGINTEQIGELTNLELGHDYLQLVADSEGVLNALPLPSQDRGNHLSYGFQWIAFGIMAPLGLGYFIWAEIRERRRAEEEEKEISAALPVVTQTEPESIDPEEKVLRDRYGNSRHITRYQNKRR
ncbi:Uncharacterized conserved protein [Corynebacterium kutscheri]|uniref:SURF1-like protein n=1 Tax=Corynebacterium kutscheri TaxID=35755 RepID=A0A0F6R1E5_9CORY|nr:SURF1 family protein [Corynebacterium kutscheri]AKE40968.1 hypothetical protein UL82_03810 [Corynebacterium kutscheri]VEH06824.1 Uncharacterized conserved protein [Corynebacterium kutscheri]VEH09267.1 Uncharacterized conserved protein [Corynebacterium kutscheri]VEH79355.1 Uncharacterized conserved protein [Corynebacterium kutscheri]